MPYFIAHRLKMVAWVYFVLSIIGAVLLFISGLAFLGIGIAILIQSFIVLFICLAIAEVLIQNETIIGKLTEAKNKELPFIQNLEG